MKLAINCISKVWAIALRGSGGYGHFSLVSRNIPMCSARRLAEIGEATKRENRENSVSLVPTRSCIIQGAKAPASRIICRNLGHRIYIFPVSETCDAKTRGVLFRVLLCGKMRKCLRKQNVLKRHKIDCCGWGCIFPARDVCIYNIAWRQFEVLPRRNNTIPAWKETVLVWLSCGCFAQLFWAWKLHLSRRCHDFPRPCCRKTQSPVFFLMTSTLSACLPYATLVP